MSYGNTKTNPYLVARPWAGYPTRNVAGDAAVSEVSRRDKGFAGEKAVDGSIGYVSPNKYHGQNNEISEWQAAASASNPWLQLTWDTPQRVRHVLLQDRSYVYHNDGQVKAYSLAFSSGSAVTGTNLPDFGDAFNEHKLHDRSTTSLRVTLTNYSGNFGGLGEVAVIARDPHFKGLLTGNASVSGQNAAWAARLFDGHHVDHAVRRFSQRRLQPAMYNG